MAVKDGLQKNDATVRSFLMIGQSNMAGRGDFNEVDPIKNDRCLMLRMGRWQRMAEPINPDRQIFEGSFHSGVCLAASFAEEIAERRGESVGLIPCADGGTRIGQWMPGEVLFDHALMMTRLAMRSSTLSGIIWHQGESNCRADANFPLYKKRLITVLTTLREELGAPELPIVLGELAPNIGEKWKTDGREREMNALIREVAAELPYCGVASSAGLTLKADGIHFDSRSLRVFGRRYAEVYFDLTEERAGE